MGIVWRLGIGVVGVGAVVWGVKELRLAAAASKKPTIVTCRELGEHGAPDNAHVVLSDFVLTPDLVVESKERSGGRTTWSRVWVPAVPSDSPYARALREAGDDAQSVPLPRPVRVIVVSRDTHDEEDVELLMSQTHLEGMVTNLITSLGEKEARLLGESYGDVSGAVILEVGREAMHPILAVAVVLAGAGVALAVLGSFLRRRRPRAGGARPAASAPEGGLALPDEEGSRAWIEEDDARPL